VAVNIEAHPDGVILPVRAQPSARRDRVQGQHGGRLKVSVTAAPEKGKANKALAKLLTKALGLRRSQIDLVSGETSADKRFLIHEISQEDLAARLNGLLT
jgi:uncharacterized protein (TIGR00251 family)